METQWKQSLTNFSQGMCRIVVPSFPQQNPMQLRSTLRHSSLGNMHFLLVPHAFLLNKTDMWQASASSISLFQVDAHYNSASRSISAKVQGSGMPNFLSTCKHQQNSRNSAINLAKQITCIHVMIFLFSDNIICVPKFLFLPVHLLLLVQITYGIGVAHNSSV